MVIGALNHSRWFHGKLKDGRKDSEQLLAAYGGPDGSFLMRESSTSAGDYTLSFRYLLEILNCLFYSVLLSATMGQSTM